MNTSALKSLHGIVLPLGPVMVLSLYFLHWSSTDPHLGKGPALHPPPPRPPALDSRHV